MTTAFIANGVPGTDPNPRQTLNLFGLQERAEQGHERSMPTATAAEKTTAPFHGLGVPPGRAVTSTKASMVGARDPPTTAAPLRHEWRRSVTLGW